MPAVPVRESMRQFRNLERHWCEGLERRVLLSTIVWANRNDPANNFSATFGANAPVALNLVDTAIEQYERVIVDFNWNSGTQYDINISMRNQAAPDFGGQTPPNQVTVDGSGAPEAANVFLGRGADNNLDGLGDGVGWYLDTQPDDFAEFTVITSGFVGDAANVGSPAFGLRDFYSLVAHEIGHAVGMTTAAGSNWLSGLPSFATSTGINDTGGAGVLWAYNSVRIGRAVLTDSDLAGSGPTAVHAALVGQSFNFNAQLYTSARDVMNNTFSGALGRRHLVSNLLAGMLADVYAYDFEWPEQFGSMYSSLDATTGQLTLRGGAGVSNDSFQILSAGGGYQISVNIGNDVPGTGPGDAFESFFTDAQVSSIVVDAGDGADTIQILSLSSNEPVTVNGGTGNDTVSVGDGDIDTEVQSPISVNGGSGTDAIWVFDQDDTLADSYTVSTSLILKPSTAFGGIDYFSDNESIVLTVNEFDNVIAVSGLFSSMSLTLNGRGGDDQFQIGSPAGVLGGAVNGNVSINGGTFGNDWVIFDDTAGTGQDIYAINGGNYQQTGSQILTFSDVERAEVRANNENSGIAAANTFGYELTIRGNDGDDLIDVGFGMLASTNDTTVFGGAGEDTLRLNDTSASAPTTFLANQTGGLPFVDLFNGSHAILFDSVADLIIDAGRFDDIITSIAVPSETALLINGNGGDDTIDVQGHPTVNSAFFPRVTVDGGAGADDVDVNTDGQGGARATFAQSQDLASLSLGVSGRLLLEPGEQLIDVATSFSMPASGGELDLTDGYFIRRNSANIAFYDARVVSGYNAGAWNGLGINSSTAAASALGDAVGLARASDIFNGGGGVIDGIALAAGDIILRYALYGDANLSGGVNSDDFNRLASSFGQNNTRWDQGNFNFDIVTNSDDFNLLATNFGLQLAAKRSDVEELLKSLRKDEAR